MFAGFGSSEPFLAVLALVVVVCAFAFSQRRRRSRVREPEDLTAFHADKFVIKPYLQLGNNPRQGGSEQVAVLWCVKPALDGAQWALQARVPGSDWRTPTEAHAQEIEINGIGKTVRCAGTLRDLPFGADVEYRVLRDGDVAFASVMRTRSHDSQPLNFVVAGDLGVPLLGKEQKVAYQIARRKPGLIVVPGDIVYERGRVSEYLSNFFPVYNSDVASPEAGAPLLRSVIMIGAPGNHDMGMPHADSLRDFSEFPDLLGYYVFFSQPLNGVQSTIGGANYPDLRGDRRAQDLFLAAAGGRFPRMACFSFEWGSSFWVVLDSNAYMDWTDAELRDWVDAQFAAAPPKAWKFASFHHPAFASDGKHMNEQRMRLLAPVFEKHGVKIVFVGHTHCYERTYPLRFKPFATQTVLHTEECPVDGEYLIDTKFDGDHNRRPDGVIYVTSGAAGARFHRSSKPKPGELKPYTRVYNQEVHSFTSCEIVGDRLTVRQLSEDNVEIDAFIIER